MKAIFHGISQKNQSSTIALEVRTFAELVESIQMPEWRKAIETYPELEQDIWEFMERILADCMPES